MVEPIVTATARLSSFRDATDAVRLSGIDIRESQVRRLAQELGQELIAARDRKGIEYRRRQLPARTVVIPVAVVVAVDGGRLRTRVAASAPGVHDAHNKEDNLACLATLKSATLARDPQPEPPPSWQCPRRVQRLVQQRKGQAGEAKPPEILGEPAAAVAPLAEAAAPQRWSPERWVRTCVARLATSASFGPLVAAEAQERHFYEAGRRAFVADGSAYNWAIQQGDFRDLEPIVDFLHVGCYLYASARAVCAEESSGWSPYLVWMRACWQGRVAEVLRELAVWQTRLGPAPPGEPGSAEERRDPGRLVAEARRYLTNNQQRMDSARYRREGLPTTSSWVAWLVGEFNARVKRKQKYWLRPQGGESILQLGAGLLSEDDRLRRYFANRPGQPFRKNRLAKKTAAPRTAQTAA